MLLQPYTLDELSFAWSSRIYVRSRTWRRKPAPWLASLDSGTLNALLEPYHVKILEFNADSVSFRAIASLQIQERISSAVSKLKGRISKWLSAQSPEPHAERCLGRGYFAVTTGKSSADGVLQYLERQGQHHGYDQRPRPPVYVKAFERTKGTEDWLATDHAVTSIRFHIVLATQRRHGVFGETSGMAVADRWKAIEKANRIWIAKVSFVPDHVHIAVEMHPDVSPAEVALNLMNEAQELMWETFSYSVIEAKLSQLWQASAYLGSYGDLTSSALSSYVRRWEQTD